MSVCERFWDDDCLGGGDCLRGDPHAESTWESVKEFMMVYNLAKRIKTLGGMTPDAYIYRCRAVIEEKTAVRVSPSVGLP